MKAVVLKQFGGPENLEYSEFETPVPGRGEVLLKVRACALNHLDLWVRSGIPAYKIKPPHILGCDLSGEVAALGPEVSAVKAGERVAVSPGRSCLECSFCLGGHDNLCESYGIIGADGGLGGYAEYVAVPARNLLPIPESLSFEEAAAFPLTFLTAWHMLITLAGLKPGQSVLVVGASSGVGTAAIQIAKLAGASVLAASTSEEKLKRAKTLGADEVIFLPKEDLFKKVVHLTGRRGVDVAFEHVGPETFEKSLKSLKKGGILVTCGATTGPGVSLDLRYVFSRELKICGARMGTLAEMRAVSSLVFEGRLKPVIDRTFPLKEAKAAHEYLASHRQFGKVLLIP